MMISFFFLLSSFSHSSAAAELVSLAESLGSETICLSQAAGISRWFLKVCFADVRSPALCPTKMSCPLLERVLTTVWAGNPHAAVEQDHDQNSSISIE